MDLDLIISAAAAVVTIGMYVVALWVGDQRTISTLAGASNFALGLFMVLVGLTCWLGLQLTLALLTHPGILARAIGNVIRQL